MSQHLLNCIFNKTWNIFVSLGRTFTIPTFTVIPLVNTVPCSLSVCLTIQSTNGFRGTQSVLSALHFPLYLPMALHALSQKLSLILHLEGTRGRKFSDIFQSLNLFLYSVNLVSILAIRVEGSNFSEIQSVTSDKKSYSFSEQMHLS